MAKVIKSTSLIQNNYKHRTISIQVVQYKQQSRLGEKRKKALDMHLSFIVDQTEKYSTWLTEGLTVAGIASIEPSSHGGSVSICTATNSPAPSLGKTDLRQYLCFIFYCRVSVIFCCPCYPLNRILYFLQMRILNQITAPPTMKKPSKRKKRISTR